MKIKHLIFFLIFLNFNTSTFAASNNDNTGLMTDPYVTASKLIKTAKKYEKKGKIVKAKKKYSRAQKFLLKSNKEKPLQADTLNYLGFTTRKLGDYKKGEEYYLLGLQIEPNHNGINEYLGELYVVTGRIDLAKERLEVLKNCGCEEFNELKQIIEGKKESKY